MNNQTLNLCSASLEQILAAYGAQGHVWEEVKPQSYSPDKWKLTEGELSDFMLIPSAREEAELILQSGLCVERFILAEELEDTKEKPSAAIPWMAIGMTIGAAGLTLVGIALVLAVISLIIGAVVLLLKVIVMVVPFLFIGALLIGGLLNDPHLIAVVRDGEEEKWICVAKYFD